MKATPLSPSEELRRKGLLDFSPSSPFTANTHSNLKLSGQSHSSSLGLSLTTKEDLYVASPSPSPPAGASSSTLCCSSSSSGEIVCGGRCRGMGAEEDCWEAVFPEAAATSPGQEQSILRLMMGDIEDPSLGLSKLLHSSSAPQNMEFCDGSGSGGFGFMDPQSFSFDSPEGFIGSTSLPDLPLPGDTASTVRQVNSFTLFSDSGMPFHLPSNETLDEKPQIVNLHSIVSHNQIHVSPNPLVAPPAFNPMQDDHSLSSSAGLPAPKRLNSGNVGSNSMCPSGNFLGSGHLANNELPPQHHHPQLYQRPALVMKQQQHKVAGEELANNQLQQEVTNYLYKAAELIKTGNPILAQGILARLNHHQLSPVGKPFSRAAFYCKEALQSLLHHQHPHLVSPAELPLLPPPPLGLIYKIEAYKSFCEISPVVQFANFTCNQAFLEALDGFSLVHILSFDVGFGGEWASLMHELVLRNGGPPSLLRITAFAFPGIHDEVEFGLIEETLKNLAHELNIALELKIVSIDSLNSVMELCSDHREAIVVNLPIASFLGYHSFLPAVLQLIKQLCPKIVVSIDRGCDRTDTPFPNCVIHTLQCYSSLLESLDAVNVDLDVLQKIERYLIQPGIERIMNGQQQAPEKMISWQSLFLSCGFSPAALSNFNESQAESLIQRSLARGFHVEKKQSSLILCWQREELVTASAWR
ncbi:hypothetical protein SAY87_000427 [Trapa incisa]|uniref:Scarecrow-like protein 6 n=1 Tax=Trapa incisa TaxID=236973 RepID=A0AAN7GF99_9MYRT|nr:hypothetical protein SAY87_000427 [Trapa incisa]